MWRKQAQADDQRVLEGLEVILVHAGVDHIQEDGRDLSASRQRVFDGCVLGQKLSREVGVGDVAVVGRELVAVKTERTNPELAPGIDLAEEAKERVCVS